MKRARFHVCFLWRHNSAESDGVVIVVVVGFSSLFPVRLSSFRSLFTDSSKRGPGGGGTQGAGGRVSRRWSGWRGSGDASTKKSGENHESKPLIRVAAGSIGPTDADRWVSMETRICPPLGPYVPTSSGLPVSVVGVSALHEKPSNERGTTTTGTPRGWRTARRRK